MPDKEEAGQSAAEEGQSAESAAQCAADGSSSCVSSAKSKAARKKANRKSAKAATAAIVNRVLEHARTLQDRDIFGSAMGAKDGWFSAFRTYKACYRAYYFAADELSDAALDWCFQLTKVNMKRMYDKTEGWGWNDKAKRKEITHKEGRFFIITKIDTTEKKETEDEGAGSAPVSFSPATSSASPPSSSSVPFEGSPVAFCNIRYTVGDQDHAPVSYVWELQIEPEAQRQGLGKYLMSLVELVSWKCQLLRVVLTVFDSNRAAMRLYTQTLRYELDETDPSLFDQEVDYKILCKKNRKLASISDIVTVTEEDKTAGSSAPPAT